MAPGPPAAFAAFALAALAAAAAFAAFAAAVFPLFLVGLFAGGGCSPFANVGDALLPPLAPLLLPSPALGPPFLFKLALDIEGVLWLVLPLADIAGLDAPPPPPPFALLLPAPGIDRCCFCGELLADDEFCGDAIVACGGGGMICCCCDTGGGYELITF